MSWRANYIRAFLAIIGIALISVGIILIHYLSEEGIGALFVAIGSAIIIFVAIWWYKNFQKGE